MKELNRKELKGKTKRDFKDGTIIRVGKYMIFIKGLNTRAESDNNPMIPLKEYEMPRYIRDIVF